jgi:hypothetical protein
MLAHVLPSTCSVYQSAYAFHLQVQRVPQLLICGTWLLRGNRAFHSNGMSHCGDDASTCRVCLDRWVSEILARLRCCMHLVDGLRPLVLSRPAWCWLQVWVGSQRLGCAYAKANCWEVRARSVAGLSSVGQQPALLCRASAGLRTDGYGMLTLWHALCTRPSVQGIVWACEYDPPG